MNYSCFAPSLIPIFRPPLQSLSRSTSISHNRLNLHASRISITRNEYPHQDNFSMSSQISAAITTFDRGHFLHPLQTANHHPTLILLLESFFNNNAVIKTVLDKHIVASKRGDVTLYCPSYPFAAAGWSVVLSLSDLVLAAVHNITLYPGKSQRPLTIPESAFEELGITSADELTIAQLQCHPNYLSTLACDSLDALHLALTNFQQFLRRVILWIASRINYSISKGFEARLDWGEDFLFRVSPATVIAEAPKRGVTAKEVYSYYKTDETSSLTHYIPHSPVYYPDIAVYIHFPYNPQ